jgi:peptidoglycan/xylan/chitin deacetylase (PgdA/CDA1 family)
VPSAESGREDVSLKSKILRKAGAILPPPLLRPLGRPVALFFHGVERWITDPALQLNHHALDDFHAIVTALKAEFDVAPLTELPSVLRRPERHRRTVFLMSDDGYANTQLAADVLEDLRLPWTLFVSTEHIDSGAPNPMFQARRFLHHAPDGVYRVPHLSEPIHLNGTRAAVAEQIIRGIRFLPSEAARESIGAMAAVLNRSCTVQDTDADCERFLTWDEVRGLHARGVAIGAHAHWHWAMHAREHPEVLRRQAEMPRRRIEAEVGPCRVFAYPFGNQRDVSAAAWRAVRDAGYDHAFTTLGGTLSGTQNPWLLPRYGLQPREPHLASMLPLMRLGNRRVAAWQKTLA